MQTLNMEDLQQVSGGAVSISVEARFQELAAGLVPAQVLLPAALPEWR